jgi:renal tumor antigen
MLPDNICLVQRLGESSFSEVSKVQFLSKETFYAMKVLKKHDDGPETCDLLPEVRYLRQFQDYPNVITLHDVLYDSRDRFVSLVFELYDCNLYE